MSRDRCRYNARVTLYDPAKGYQVRVPGLDAVAEEWVDESRLRPRKRAGDAGRSPAPTRSVPGGGDASPLAMRQMRLRQEKRRMAAAAQGRLSSSSAGGPEASPAPTRNVQPSETQAAGSRSVARREGAGSPPGPEATSPASEGEAPSPLAHAPPPPPRRLPDVSASAPRARPLDSGSYTPTNHGLSNTVSEQQWLRQEPQLDDHGADEAQLGGDLNFRSLKLGHRELARRLDSLERLCNQEREARVQLEAEVRDQRQLIKQGHATGVEDREEVSKLRSIVSSLELTAGELGRTVPQLRREVDEQREAHDQFAEDLIEAVEECVSKDTLVEEQKKIAEKMTEYWDRELGATASQAELQENRRLVEEQLQHGMQALLRHVEQVGADFTAEVERLEQKAKSVQASTVNLQQSVERSQGLLEGRVQESEEKILLQLGPMAEQVDRMLERQVRCQHTRYQFGVLFQESTV